MKKPILFATLGFPGSGKTYFSRKFASDLGLIHLNSDRLRREMFLTPDYSIPESDILFRTMDYITSELLARGIGVIFDANATKKEYRERLQEIARNNNARFLLLWVKTPLEIARKRNKEREALSEEERKHHGPVSESALYRLKNQQEEPQDEPYVVIDGELPYEDQKKIALHYITTI